MSAKLLSEYTAADVAAALRIDGDTPDEMERIMASSIAYIEGVTGIPATSQESGAETLDDYPDIVHAFLVLCQDGYDNRAYVQEKTQGVNLVVDDILGMHRRCLAR